MLTTAPAALAQFTNGTQAQLAHTQSSMVFNFTAPIITNSGVRGSTHFIRVAVVGMSLKDLMISIPNQMEKFDGVRVLDQSGKEVASKINLSQN